MTGTERVVYTCITANYDNLLPPACLHASWRWVAFTDRPRRVWPWETQPTPPAPSPHLASRLPKIAPHLLLPDAEFSIYHDGAFHLLVSPDEALTLLGDADIALFRHQHSRSIHDEFAAYSGQAPADVRAEYARLRALEFPESDFYLGGLIIRRHSLAVTRFNELWLIAHANGSYNDQFSLAYALAESKLRVAAIPGDALWSPYFGYALHRHAGGMTNEPYEQENRYWDGAYSRLRDLIAPVDQPDPARSRMEVG